MFKFKKFDNKNEMTICIVDNCGGAYLSIAKHMSKYFSKSFYHSVNQNPFPRLSLDQVGTGYDDIIVISEFWSSLDQFDIIMFPDIYFNDWGSQLRKMGKLVWGGCESEVIETDRKVFKDELDNAKLPNGKATYITGITNLRKHLQNVEDKWIKISYFRGEIETYHHIDFEHSKQWLNEISYTMGPLGELLTFIVNDPIDSIIELGCDTWCINGVQPVNKIWGCEVKDCGYIGKVSSENELPEPISYVNTMFQPILQKYKHTGFYSTEIRYTKEGIPYYTDPCMRAGSPPSNTYMALIDNWADIVIAGCKGEIVEPTFIGEYGVEIILKSNYCNEGYLSISYPEEFSDNIRLKGSFKVEGAEYIIPFTHCGFDMTEFGSVVVVGSNLEDCISQALEISSKVDGYKVEYNAAALPEAIESINKLQETLNIKF